MGGDRQTEKGRSPYQAASAYDADPCAKNTQTMLLKIFQETPPDKALDRPPRCQETRATECLISDATAKGFDAARRTKTHGLSRAP